MYGLLGARSIALRLAAGTIAVVSSAPATVLATGSSPPNRQVLRDYGMPREPFDDMLDGMRMDVVKLLPLNL